MNPTAPTSISDVLSGNASLKMEVSVNTMSVIILSAAMFIAVLAAVVIARKIV